MRTNYEDRFYIALKRITAYMTPAQLRRNSEREYGLDHAEALEMAYENVIDEAREALRGYRKPKPAGGNQASMEPAQATSASAAQKTTSTIYDPASPETHDDTGSHDD